MAEYEEVIRLVLDVDDKKARAKVKDFGDSSNAEAAQRKATRDAAKVAREAEVGERRKGSAATRAAREAVRIAKDAARAEARTAKEKVKASRDQEREASKAARRREQEEKEAFSRTKQLYADLSQSIGGIFRGRMPTPSAMTSIGNYFRGGPRAEASPSGLITSLMRGKRSGPPSLPSSYPPLISGKTLPSIPGGASSVFSALKTPGAMQGLGASGAAIGAGEGLMALAGPVSIAAAAIVAGSAVFARGMESLIGTLGKYNPIVSAQMRVYEVKEMMFSRRIAAVMQPAMSAWIDLKSSLLDIGANLAGSLRPFVTLFAEGIQGLSQVIGDIASLASLLSGGTLIGMGAARPMFGIAGMLAGLKGDDGKPMFNPGRAGSPLLGAAGNFKEWKDSINKYSKAISLDDDVKNDRLSFLNAANTVNGGPNGRALGGAMGAPGGFGGRRGGHRGIVWNQPQGVPGAVGNRGAAGVAGAGAMAARALAGNAAVLAIVQSALGSSGGTSPMDTYRNLWLAEKINDAQFAALGGNPAAWRRNLHARGDVGPGEKGYAKPVAKSRTPFGQMVHPSSTPWGGKVNPHWLYDLNSRYPNSLNAVSRGRSSRGRSGPVGAPGEPFIDRAAAKDPNGNPLFKSYPVPNFKVDMKNNVHFKIANENAINQTVAQVRDKLMGAMGTARDEARLMGSVLNASCDL